MADSIIVLLLSGCRFNRLTGAEQNVGQNLYSYEAVSSANRATFDDC